MSDINWDDFNYGDLNWDEFSNGMWNSNSTGGYYNSNEGSNNIFNGEIDEDELTHQAFNNTYKILVGLKTIEEIMDEGNDTTPFIFDPEEFKSKDNIFHSKNQLIDDVIDYFCYLEEFEKCAELLKLKK